MTLQVWMQECKGRPWKPPPFRHLRRLLLPTDMVPMVKERGSPVLKQGSEVCGFVRHGEAEVHCLKEVLLGDLPIS